MIVETKLEATNIYGPDCTCGCAIDIHEVAVTMQLDYSKFPHDTELYEMTVNTDIGHCRKCLLSCQKYQAHWHAS